jgi:2-polyprenyl-6-methoxyphenol hydroxylase-like FAD-dependent oxidoreductase
MKTDFVIVGGGIGGLVLAELLGRGGKRVVVLERSTGPPPWNRPEVLWPATIKLLCTLLPRQQWEEEAVLPLGGMELFNGREFVWGISPEILERAGVQPWSTNPNQTRELLMRLSSFELHRGVEVKEVLKEKGQIVGVLGRHMESGREQEWLARWTVGDDGANSLVRKACGIRLDTRLLPVDLLCFQCDWPREFRPNAGRIWPNWRTAKAGILALGSVPFASRKGVGIVPVRPQVFDDLPRTQAAWREFVEMEPALTTLVGGRRFPEDFQRVRRPWGHAARYGTAGALLMGDAAHPVSPAGGQGANMSVADGRSIAELVLAGRYDLMEAYQRRRRAANERSMRFTRVAAFAFGLPHGLVFNAATGWLARQAGRHPSLIARAIRFISTAFLERAYTAQS